MRFLAVAILLLVSACTSTWQFSTFEESRLDSIATQLCPGTKSIHPLCGVPMTLSDVEAPIMLAGFKGVQATKSVFEIMSNDELAFILSHELGHILLHIRIPIDKRPPHKLREMQADHFALYLTTCRDFDPFAGATSLKKILYVVPEESKPFIRLRIKLIEEYDTSKVDCNG